MNSKKGSVTIFLALVMLFFLTFCLVLVEGTRNYYLKVKAMQAMELAEFSVLSEFQQELFRQYGLFFLELDYEQGDEQIGVLERRTREYLDKNAEELVTSFLSVDKLSRATDNGGNTFFKQAVELMKVNSGFHRFEELIGNVENVTLENIDLGAILEKNESAAGGILNDVKEDENSSLPSVSLPNISFPSVQALRDAVFGSEEGLSEKSVNLEERLLKRDLKKGVGIKSDISAASMQMFHGYIFQHCSYYGDRKSDVWKDLLEYQVEYIISGRESDKDNLENILWRIFLLRTGGNYLFYHQDSERIAKAQAEAVALVGVLGNAALIELVKEIFLISQAIEDGITQTRQVFSGEKVPLYENGAFSGIYLGYEEYLYLFLNTTDAVKKIYRCMDIVELEVRKKSGYEGFRLDHCVDCFEVQWNYQFESLFMEIPFLEGGIYENAITRKIYYEN